MENKKYLVFTNNAVHEVFGKERLAKKVQALQILDIDFKVYESLQGETREVLVNITDYVIFGKVGGINGN